ncbi:MAG: protein kinase [Akkermansiaceae bacterium]|nr:protein kinase [Akkermansiaceae bacterium]MCP5546052.1 protein kinase [Akkermansiaceae bacterium]
MNHEPPADEESEPDPLMGNRITDLIDCAFDPGAAPSDPGGWSLPDEDELKRILPNYQILALLGRGGMGVVYKAYDTVLRNTVAVKLLPQALASDHALMARFKKEARILSQLDHPGIVKVRSFVETGDGQAYFVMDFVEGRTVHELVREKRLKVRDALKLVTQVCKALQYLHDQGVVHRDIKPTNILVDEAGNARLVDFGIAGQVSAETLVLTRTGQTPGTPFYIAPELYDGVPPTPRSDVYSLGVTFYEMLTGERPHIRSPAPSSVSGVYKGVDRVVFRALNRKPDRRYPSADSLRRDLQRCTRRAREIRLAWVIAALMFLAGGVYLGWHIAPRGKPKAVSAVPLASAPAVMEEAPAVVEATDEPAESDPFATDHPLEFPSDTAIAPEHPLDFGDPPEVASDPFVLPREEVETPPQEVADPTDELRRVLMGHTWSYEDSLFPNKKENMPREGRGKPKAPIRFFPNGKFHDHWKWNYWIIGPRAIHVQYSDPVYRTNPDVVLTFSEDFLTYSGGFRDGRGKYHKITGTRIDPIR